MELRNIIRDELAGPGELDPRSVAERVAHQVPSKDVRKALAEALPHMVRDMIVQTRRNVVPPTPQNRSSKVAAIREQHKARLVDAIYPAADGTYKRAGEFTYDDCIALADRIHAKAMQNLATEKVWRAVADRLTQTGSATVDDIADADDLLAGAA